MTQINWLFSKKTIFSIFGFFSFVIFCLTLNKYSGNKALYTFFTLSFVLLFLFSFYKPRSFVACFLSVFLYLGLWLKLSVHTILESPYIDPTGHFDFSPAAWDKVLLVSLIGIGGVISAYALTYLFSIKTAINSADISLEKVPRVYRKHRKFIYILIFSVLMLMASANLIFHIHQVGLYSQLVFPYSILHAVFGWSLKCAFCILLCFTLYWDFQLQDPLVPSAYLILIESLASNISILSRGYILHTIPQMLVVWKEKNFFGSLSRKYVFSILATFILAMVLSLFSAKILRDKIFHLDDLLSEVQKKQPQKTIVVDNSYQRLGSMLIERWIGIEGVMSVTSYNGLNSELLKKIFKESSKDHEAPIFDKEINVSPYALMDTSKYQFGSMPGGVALFFVSGSKTVEFAGMLLLTLFFICFESLLFRIYDNPFIGSFFGINAALAIAQFGYRPRATFIYYIAFAVTVLIIKYFVKWIDRFYE